MAKKLQLVLTVDDKGSVKVTQFAQKAKSSLNSIEKDTKSASTAMSSGLGVSVASVTKLVAALGIAWGGVKLAGFIKESAMAAARYETLGIVMETVGRNAGISAEEVNRYAKSLQVSGISMTSSREVVTKLIQAHIDLTQATKLGRIAQDAAVIGNIDSSAALERMVYGIQTAQIEVLKTIGITVNFENAYKKLAEQLGKTANNLTDAEKTQARLNTVIERGADIAGTYESAMSTAGKKITSFKRYLDDFKVKMGEAFGPATVILVDTATTSMKEFTKQVSSPEAQKSLQEMASNVFILADAMAGLVKAGAWVVKTLDLRSVTNTFREGLQLSKDGLIDFDKFVSASFRDRQNMVDAIISKQKAEADVAGLVTVAIGSTTEGYAIYNDEVSKTKDIIGKNTEALQSHIKAVEAMNIILNEELIRNAEDTFQYESGLLDAKYEKRKAVVGDSILLEKWYSQQVNLLVKERDEGIAKEILLEQDKTEVVKNLFDDMVQDHLAAANAMIETTSSRVNEEIALENRKKAASQSSLFEGSMVSEHGLGVITGKSTVYYPKPSNITNNDNSITNNLLTTSNNYLSNIDNTQSDLLSEFQKQTSILSDAFGSVNDLVKSMTFGDLAPTENISALGAEYAGLLELSRSDVDPAAQKEAVSKLVSLVPSYLKALESTSSDYLDSFNSIKTDLQNLEAALGFDIFESGFEFLSETIKLSDYITFDLDELNAAINTGKLDEAKALIGELTSQLQTALPDAVSAATGGQGIEGFNLGLIGTQLPLGNTVTSTATDLKAIGDMFTDLAGQLTGTTIPQITGGIADIAAQAGKYEGVQYSWVQTGLTSADMFGYRTPIWSLFNSLGNMVGSPVTSVNKPEVPNFGASGGLMSSPTIGGEAGPEWFVPTYEPQRSSFLKSVGVEDAMKKLAGNMGGGNQTIILKVDGREIARVIANQGRSNPELIKMIREVA